MQKMSRTCQIIIPLFINADVKDVTLQTLKPHQVAFTLYTQAVVCISDSSVQRVTGISLSRLIRSVTITKQMAPSEV